MDINVIKQQIESLKKGDTVAIPILITALSIPALESVYRDITDALILFIDNNPDQKAFVQIILDSSTLDKEGELAKELLGKLNS